MTNLIKSDFKRFFKDKMFLIICILAAGFAVLTTLLYIVIFGIAGTIDPAAEELLAGSVYAKGQFFGAFSFGNNFGLIAPLLVAIIFYKDFTFGTVRNKIISGHSRTSIFFSVFIVSSIVLCAVMLIHALLTLLISLTYFDYQATPFVMADFWYLLESLLFDLLIYLFAAALVTWLCMTKKNVGIVIVLYVAIVMGCTLVGAILQIVSMALMMNPNTEKTMDVINFFQRINLFNSSAVIGTGTSYTTEDVLYYTLTPVGGMLLLLLRGSRKFNRSDLK